MKTRITELLGIAYPIVLAPMAWITDAELAAAVSEAGGLGTIGPNAGFKTVTTDVRETGERLREQIRKCRELTSRPFAVNFVVGVTGLDRAFSDQCLKIGLEERIPVAIVSQGSPAVYTPLLRKAGIKVIHVCSTVRHALKAEEAGVDAVVVSGTEGGGHSGFDQITTFCLVPQVADAVAIPVIAGGGVTDARGLLSALSLGAEGAYMGTRFIATRECPAHPKVKQAILAAADTGTLAVRHGSPAPTREAARGNRGFVEERRGSVRILLTDYVRRILADAGGNFSYESLRGSDNSDRNVQSNRTVEAFIYGKLESNSITAGQGSGLIKDIPTCRELIRRIMREIDLILKRLNVLCRP